LPTIYEIDDILKNVNIRRGRECVEWKYLSRWIGVDFVFDLRL
jgi:hypothetical protein